MGKRVNMRECESKKGHCWSDLGLKTPACHEAASDVEQVFLDAEPHFVSVKHKVM